MYAPRVFVSMIGVLVVFGIAAYVMSGSFLAALGWTVLCAVILQVGYFLGIVYMVKREQEERAEKARSERAGARQRKDDAVDIRADATARLTVNDR